MVHSYLNLKRNTECGVLICSSSFLELGALCSESVAAIFCFILFSSGYNHSQQRRSENALLFLMATNNLRGINTVYLFKLNDEDMLCMANNARIGKKTQKLFKFVFVIAIKKRASKFSKSTDLEFPWKKVIICPLYLCFVKSISDSHSTFNQNNNP